MGIDPGLARTGIGVISHNHGEFKRIHSDVIRTDPNLPMSERLAKIVQAVRACVLEYRPAAAAVERVFVSVNPNSALQLGQARGAVMATLGENGLPVAEISPLAVKKNLTGDSKADKRKVATIVRSLFAIAPQERLAIDASDALAVAAAYRSTSRLRLRRTKRR